MEGDLASFVDDLPPRTVAEDKLEVQRLLAARVALERRLGMLDGSKDRRSGIPAPFVPTDERPWRSSAALDKAIEEGRLKSDPTADVSLPQEPSSILQQELDNTPKEVLEAEQAEIKEALRSLSASIAAADASAQELARAQGEVPGADVSSSQGTLLPEIPEATSREASGTVRQSLSEEEPTVSWRPQEEPEAEEASPSKDSEEQGALSKDTGGVAEGLLPGLSKQADAEAEGALLPKPSDINFKEEGASRAELASAQEAVVDVKPPQPHVRRSQKPVPRVPGQLRLVSGGACIAAPGKLAVGKGGEDAFFVSEALWGAIGVADGVGGWSSDGIDPSLYSRRLLEVAAAATEHGWGRRKGQGARGLMHIAQTGTMDISGTSTVCIGQMMVGQTLQIANLGDSGFRIFRDAECLFASEVQQHSFNCPYQAGSPKLLPNSNTADDAEVYEIDLQENDMVVMATDGVFDNLWDEDISNIIASYLEERDAADLDGEDAAALASAIVEAAHVKGVDAQASTPWINEVAEHQPQLLSWRMRLFRRGGKPDDCTVVVAIMRADDNQY